MTDILLRKGIWPSMRSAKRTDKLRLRHVNKRTGDQQIRWKGWKAWTLPGPSRSNPAHKLGKAKRIDVFNSSNAMDLLMLHCSLAHCQHSSSYIYRRRCGGLWRLLSFQTLHIRHDPNQMRHFPFLGAGPSVAPVLRLVAGQAQSLVRHELVNARVDTRADGNTTWAERSARLIRNAMPRRGCKKRNGWLPKDNACYNVVRFRNK